LFTLPGTDEIEGESKLGAFIKIIGVLLLGILAGCNQATLMKKVTPPEDEAAARRYVDLLRQNRFEQIEQDLDPVLKRPNLRDTLVTMAAMFPAQEPASAKVVGLRMFVGPDSRGTSITLEYEFPEKWLLVNVVKQNKGGVASVVGFHVTPVAESLEDLNRFTLANKSTSHYAILFLAVLAPLFSLYAFVLCIKTKIKRMKWLWLVFTLLGVGQLGVNWTTGQILFTPIAVHLPPSGAAAPLYEPWLVYVSLPLGAIIFLFRRKSFGGSVQADDQSGPVVQEVGVEQQAEGASAPPQP
jgi:hypothetical protein